MLYKFEVASFLLSDFKSATGYVGQQYGLTWVKSRGVFAPHL
jgi:hypothetical protein